MNFKPYIVNDKSLKSSRLKKIIQHQIETFNLPKSNLIIVIGGDGFMLKTLKRMQKYTLPFYGINSGSYGFLMNTFSKKKI